MFVPPDYPSKSLPVLLGSIVLGPYHHLDSFEGLPVVGRVVLCRHVVPCSPEDPVPDPLVPLVIVLPIEVGGHAGIEPPAGAVVGAAVSGGVHVIVAVRCGEKLLVMVEVLIETDGVPSGPTTMKKLICSSPLCIFDHTCMLLQNLILYLYPLIDSR